VEVTHVNIINFTHKTRRNRQLRETRKTSPNRKRRINTILDHFRNTHARGIIDELKIYNRALSPEEIRAEYERAPETVQTQTVTLTGRTSTAITLTWDTTGFAKGNYTISVMADSISGEMDITDNNFISGIVTIAKVGDINADGRVDVKDVYAVARAYGTTSSGPNPLGRHWNPHCDINEDGRIDMKDYYIVCRNYGKTYS
jgi:hypothetical protein